MRKCAHCHKYIRLWQPYYTSKKTLKDYHTSCWNNKSTKEEAFNELGQLPKADMIRESSVPYISLRSTRIIGTLIILVVLYLGQMFSRLENRGVQKFWIALIVVLIALITYIIIKFILYFKKN